MAFQEGMVRLRGKIGNIVNYRRKGKYLSKKAAESYEQTENTKKSGMDFGKASSAGALIRKAFTPILKNLADDEFYNRLNGKLSTVIHTGPAMLIGNRQVTDGDLGLLKEIEFNRFTPTKNLLHILPTVQLDASDTIQITLPKMIIAQAFAIPPKATKAVLQLICCTFDFPGKNGRFVIPDELHIPLDKETFPGGMLDLPLDTLEERVLVVAIGISFRTADGVQIGNRKYYGGRIIESALVRDGKIVPFQYPEPDPVPPTQEPVHRVSWKLNDEDAAS
ncbi:MAG TPA: hypothetical protein VJ647_06010 [Chitinophagaceae bacterium]|nr:hypothetical protein [Chitinophagaceae bacterium]